MNTDTELLEFIATAERVTATSKYCVQVISKNGAYCTEYFALPPHGVPTVVHATRLEALRYALNKSIKSELRVVEV